MAVSNIFIPGMSDDFEELNKTLEVLEENGVSNIIIFDAKKYTKGKDFGYKLHEEMASKIGKISSCEYNKQRGKEYNYILHSEIANITGDEKYNIIGHSMGCNYAIMLYNQYINLMYQNKTNEKSLEDIPMNKMVLISPMIIKADSYDRKDIKKRNAKNLYYEEMTQNQISMNSTIKALREFKTFIEFDRTRRIADVMAYRDIMIPLLIAYSSGDKYVSQYGLSSIRGNDKQTLEVGSTMHNPLLSRKGPELARKISGFLK